MEAIERRALPSVRPEPFQPVNIEQALSEHRAKSRASASGRAKCVRRPNNCQRIESPVEATEIRDRVAPERAALLFERMLASVATA